MRRGAVNSPARRAGLLLAAIWLGAAGPPQQPSAGPGQLLAPQAGGGGMPTLSLKTGWQPPPGATPAATSFIPGDYDFSGFRMVFNGKPSAPAAALEVVSRNNAVLVGLIGRQDRISPARLRVVLPDHDRLRVLAAQQMKQPIPGIIDFRAEQLRLDLHMIADSVARAGLFGSVDIVEQNDTARPNAGGASILLWYPVRQVQQGDARKWVGIWLVTAAGRAGAAPVTMDPGTPVGPPRLLSFIASLRAGLGQPPANAGQAVASNDPALRRLSSNGTGIVIDGQGHLLTNAHVAGACGDLRFTAPDGDHGRLDVVAADPANDLALLRAERHWPAWARFRDSHALRPGEPVVAAGFPLSGLVSPEMAVTTGSVTTLAGMRGDSRQFQFSAPIQPGNSGGPVLDEQGRVIGIAFSELNGLALAAATGGAMPQNVNFAIKTDIVRAFLAGSRIALTEARDGAAIGAASVGDMARTFTVRVECWK